MKKNILFKTFIYFLLFLTKHSFSQNLIVGSISESILREKQLLGYHIKNSFHIRPISIDSFLLRNDSNLLNNIFLNDIKQSVLPGKLYFNPLNYNIYFNSSRPFGWNNGSFISAKGFQNRLSFGLMYLSKYLNVNFQPEYIYSQNPNYESSIYYGSPTKGKYSRYFLGQSFAEIKYKNMSLGFSNENIWWGPGQTGSLIFSNNAPGFGHLYFKSVKPITSRIGNIEWQLVSGGLDQDTSLNSESFRQKPSPYPRKWIYLNAITATFNPKFFPGLFLGFTRSLSFYGNGIDSNRYTLVDKYLPAVGAFFKGKINTQIDSPGENDEQDQQASIFLRFLLPKANFEFYVEYGYNDFKANVRDFIQDAQHASAYIFGFKKLFNKIGNSYFSLSGEIVQMSQPSNYTVRNGSSWYVGASNLQGYKVFNHMNQILGAGNGTGNNFQTLTIELIKEQSRYGFKIQRVQNDPRAFFTDVNRLWLSPYPWNDFVLGPSLHKSRKNILIQSELLFVRSKNYAWKEKSKINLFSNINITYKW